MNKRLLLAVVLSFLFLTVYSYLVPQKKSVVGGDINGSKKEEVVASKNVNAPIAPSVATNSASSSIKNKIPTVDIGKVIATVKTEKYNLSFDNLGRVSSIKLIGKKYQVEEGKPLELINPDAIRPLEVRFKDDKLNNLAFTTDYKSSVNSLDATNSAKEITLEQNIDGKIIKKIIKFYPDGHYDISVKAPADVAYLITPGFRPTVDKSRYLVVRGVIVRDANGVITTLEDGDVDKPQTFNNTTVVSSTDRYYTTLFYKKSGVFNTIVAASGVKGYENAPIPFIDVKGDLDLEGYAGAKEWELFSKLDPKLTDVIEFGWFTFLAKPFFKVMLSIYHFVGNWGWAIVLFTILVKIVLFPLSYKGLMSMQKMKDLAPKMKELKEKYGKDPAKMNQQMMALYKKHGANPMGGCLPMLLQIPIFFALYRVLLNAEELQGAPWIAWITDLSQKDPYYVLPVLMGATMFIQQKVTPNTMTDPMQKKIFQWLPVLMTFFFLTFPAGLVLYWLTNNILTIAQQYYINGAYERYKLKIKNSKNSSES